jgi:glycosyltransferase involved in cell wall biosynthesis
MGIPYKHVRSYDWLLPQWVIQSIKFKLTRPIKTFINIIAEARIFLILKNGKFDGYHLNSIYSGVGVKAAMALKIPVFWHLREFVDDNPWTSTFINENYSYRLIEKSYKIIAVSECVKKYYHAKMPKANIDVVYDGVDFSSLDIPHTILTIHSPLRLSIIGGVTEVKGHEDAINAAGILREMNIPFVLSIYGRKRDNRYFEYLKELIFDKNLGKLVLFKGDKTDMGPVWKETDICLICSKSESFGRVAVEAMYQNIPIIGADNSGTKELLGTDTISFQYITGDPVDLSRKIINMINKEYSENEFERNHKKALSFDSNVCAQKLSEVLGM